MPAFHGRMLDRIKARTINRHHFTVQLVIVVLRKFVPSYECVFVAVVAPIVFGFLSLSKQEFFARRPYPFELGIAFEKLRVVIEQPKQTARLL